MKLVKKYLKNERGLTLIELLAVVVILGIIAAIAIPSIGGLIDNTKKDAHIANAQQMISSAKTAVSSNSELVPAANGTVYLSLGFLVAEGYLDSIKDPDGDNTEANGYDLGDATLAKIKTAPDATDSYVAVTADATGKKITYSVKLMGIKKDVKNTDGTPVAEGGLTRSKVQ